MKVDEAVGIIAEDISDSSLRNGCVRLARHLYVHHSQINHLTFTRLGELMGLETSEDLLKATQYLCGVRINLLSIRFELIDGDDAHQISGSELAEARKTKVLMHPETGKPISDFEKKIYPYFVPGSSVVKDASDGRT